REKRVVEDLDGMRHDYYGEALTPPRPLPVSLFFGPSPTFLLAHLPNKKFLSSNWPNYRANDTHL
ncbi:hypothetical protein PIB30_086811, partial [Stylosanthes scabra]|nr:hypothetical protein [Stylosanthes scabra]